VIADQSKVLHINYVPLEAGVLVKSAKRGDVRRSQPNGEIGDGGNEVGQMVRMRQCGADKFRRI
jgi:hypothetical protein